MCDTAGKVIAGFSSKVRASDNEATILLGCAHMYGLHQLVGATGTAIAGFSSRARGLKIQPTILLGCENLCGPHEVVGAIGKTIEGFRSQIRASKIKPIARLTMCRCTVCVIQMILTVLEVSCAQTLQICALANIFSCTSLRDPILFRSF